MASMRKREWTSPTGEKKSAFEVSYKDGDGKRRAKQFPRQAEARKLKLKIETEIEAGTHVAERQTVTIRDLCREYLTYSEGRVADGRIGKMRHRSIDMAVRNSIVKHLGSIKIKDLTALRVERFYGDMTQKDGLKPKSAKYRIQMLKQVADFAVKHGYAKVNVVPLGLKELRGIPEPIIRQFKPEEVTRLLTAAAIRPKGSHKHANATMNLIVNVAAFCGLRFGEIMGLCLSNVDLDARMLRVRRNLSRLDGLKAPKTPAGRRDVPLPTHLVGMLRDYIAEFYHPNPDELIIRTSKGGRLLSTSFHSAHWPDLLSRAGLLDGGDGYHFHALRHFAASFMIANGVPVTDVARLLGHAKFDMTLQVYAHPIVDGSRCHDAVDRMSRSLIAAPIVLDAA